MSNSTQKCPICRSFLDSRRALTALVDFQAATRQPCQASRPRATVYRCTMPETRTKGEELDNPIERLRLLGEDDGAISSFLDTLDVHGPREREMLAELARTHTLARAESFFEAHGHAVEALESLGRHGYHGSTVAKRLGPLRVVPRFLVELVARYIVVSSLRQAAIDLRNLHWLREMQAAPGTEERRLLRRARLDAEGLILVSRRREVGLPSFLLGGLLLPVLLSIGRLAAGALESTVQATVVGLLGTLVVVLASWVILHGAAMASRRIKLAASEPLATLWRTIGWCGKPTRDQSRKLAVVAIALTALAWIVLPVAIGIALTST
jgi:hypothetical protein